MAGHPIEGLMRTTMESLKSMVDVNTVVGEPVETKDGTVIMPVSRVSFGFVAGGGDEAAGGGGENQEEESGAAGSETMPFTGGSGAGVSVKPVGFLVVGPRKVRFIPVDSQAIYDRLLDEAPELLDRFADMIGGREGVENFMDCAKEKVEDALGEKEGRRPRRRGSSHYGEDDEEDR